MSLPAKISAGTVLLAVLALVAVAVLRGGGGNGADGPPPPSANGEPTDAQDPEDRSVELAGAGAGAERATARGDLVVLVSDKRDRALRDATVEVFEGQHSASRWFFAGGEAPLRGEPRTSARTDEEGRAQITLLSNDAWIVARAEGRAPAIRYVGAPLDETSSLLRIRLEAGHGLEGRVLDTRGRPVAGVLVAAYESRSLSDLDVLRHRPHAVSGPDGRYTLTSLSPEMTVVAVARPGATLRDVASIRIPEVSHFDVILPSTAILRGTVTHADTKRPLEGVEVRASVGNGWDAQRQTAKAVTDARGIYEIAALPPVRLLRVVAERGDLVQTVPPGAVHRQDVILSAEGGPVVSDLAMRPGTYVEGVVRSIDGPVAEARVHIEPDDRRRAGGANASTNSNGSFRCGPLLAGTYGVTVHAWGYEAGEESIELRDGAPATVTLTIARSEEEDGDEARGAPEREILVRGVVRTPAGKTAAGACVDVRDFFDDRAPAWDAPFEWAVPCGSWTGEDGTFTARLATTVGRVEVRASLAGFAPARPVILRLRPDTDEYEAELVLRSGHTLEATVVDAETGRAVPRATVALVVPAEHTGHVDWIDGPPAPAVHTMTTEAGRIALEHVPEGEYALDVGAPGYLGARRPTKAPSTDTIVVELEPALSLGGTVAFADGTDPGVLNLAIAAVKGGFRRRVKTDARGRFHVAGVPAGEYTIEVDRAIGNRVNILEEVLGPFAAGRTDLALEVRPGRTITGRVVGPEGASVSGALITADGEDGRSAGHLTYTDQTGAFEVTGLADVRVRLEVEATGYLGRTTDWIPSGTRGVVVTLERGGTISGVVVDEDGRPVAGLYVAAVEPDEDGYVDDDAPHAATGEDGTFTIGGITLDRVQLALLQNFTMRVLLDVESVDVGTRNLRIVCSKGATISGQVLDAYGEPVEGAEVLAEPATYGTHYVEVTDKEGRFTLTALFPDRDYALEVRWRDPEDNEESERSGIPARSGATNVVIRLE